MTVEQVPWWGWLIVAVAVLAVAGRAGAWLLRAVVVVVTLAVLVTAARAVFP